VHQAFRRADMLTAQTSSLLKKIYRLRDSANWQTSQDTLSITLETNLNSLDIYKVAIFFTANNKMRESY